MNNFMYVSKSFVPFEYDIKDADVVFLGIPFSSTSVSSPSIYGPTIVRESMKILEGFEDGINIFEKFKIVDVGDVEVVPGSYELTEKRIIDTINEIKSVSNAKMIFVGGEHLITLAVAKALRPKTIISFDAHPDTRDDYMGNKLSHTTWARRASEFAQVYHIGTRTSSKDEFVNRLPDDFKFEKPVHISVDVDVLDMAYVETGLPEPGGMNPVELLDMIRKLAPIADSLDIVEIADNHLPSKTGIIAANVIKKFLVGKC